MNKKLKGETLSLAIARFNQELGKKKKKKKNWYCKALEALGNVGFFCQCGKTWHALKVVDETNPFLKANFDKFYAWHEHNLDWSHLYGQDPQDFMMFLWNLAWEGLNMIDWAQKRYFSPPT